MEESSGTENPVTCTQAKDENSNMFSLFQDEKLIISCAITKHPDDSNHIISVFDSEISGSSPFQTLSYPLVESVSGSVSGNDLTVSVNGVSSDPITLPSGGGGTGSGPTFTVLNSTLDTITNNTAKFAEWVANAKVGDNIKIIGIVGSAGQFISTFDMSVVARDDDAKLLVLGGTGTARIMGITVGHTAYWIPITAMSISFAQPSNPSFSGSVCYDTSGMNVVDVSLQFSLGTEDTYVLLTSY